MSQIARQLRRGRPGFSLIEIVMVVVIIAILALIAIPYYRGTIEHGRMSGAASQILGDIRQMQSSAIAQGRMYRLLAGTDSSVSPSKPNQYCVQSSTNQGATWAPAIAACAWVNIPALFPNAGMGFNIQDSAGTPVILHQVQFNSRGIALHPSSPTFPINIRVTTTGRAAKVIQVLRTGSTKAP